MSLGCTTRFGTTDAQRKAVTEWLTGQGFTITGSDAHAVDVTGTVAQIDAAFATQFDEYDQTYPGKTGTRTVRTGAINGGLSVPGSVGGDITSVTGFAELPLDSTSTTNGSMTLRKEGGLKKAAADVTCSSYWGEKQASIPAAFGHTTANTGICGYTPDQLR